MHLVNTGPSKSIYAANPPHEMNPDKIPNSSGSRRAYANFYGVDPNEVTREHYDRAKAAFKPRQI